VKKMMKRECEAFLEDPPAASSSDSLKSIQEARPDVQAGRVRTHAEVFGGKSARFKTPEPVQLTVAIEIFAREKRA
jgi:hypothetical protein